MQLSQQLQSLLCPMLLKLASPHQAVKVKLMSALSHINKVGLLC